MHQLFVLCTWYLSVPVTLPKEIRGARQLPTSFQGICLQCIKTNAAKGNIFGVKATVRPWIEESSERISHELKLSKKQMKAVIPVKQVRKRCKKQQEKQMWK
jgi:hypothetical protein